MVCDGLQRANEKKHCTMKYLLLVLVVHAYKKGFVVCALCCKVLAPWALLVETPLKVAPISAGFESSWVTLVVSLSPGWLQSRICRILSGWKWLFGIHASALRWGLCLNVAVSDDPALKQAHGLHHQFWTPRPVQWGWHLLVVSPVTLTCTHHRRQWAHCKLPSRTPNQHRTATAKWPHWSRQWSRNHTCRR